MMSVWSLQDYIAKAFRLHCISTRVTMSISNEALRLDKSRHLWP